MVQKVGSHQSGPLLPVLGNGSFEGGSSLLLCEPRRPEHAARARQNIRAILCCKAAAGEYPQTVNSTSHWQELFLLTSAVFIIA